MTVINTGLFFILVPVICLAAVVVWMVLTTSVLFVYLYEEPHLRKTFGAAYEEYCRSVPRWIPRLK